MCDVATLQHLIQPGACSTVLPMWDVATLQHIIQPGACSTVSYQCGMLPLYNISSNQEHVRQSPANVGCCHSTTSHPTRSMFDSPASVGCCHSTTSHLTRSMFDSLLPMWDVATLQHIIQPGACSTVLPMWDVATLQHLINYHTQTGLLLSAINVAHDALCCTDSNCNDEGHYSHLCKFYEDITNLLSDAVGAIPTKAHFVIGWNDLVSESHQAARESFLIWRSARSPLLDIMKTKRADFKQKKRLCENNDETLKADRLASKLSCNNFNNFLRISQKLTMPSCKLPAMLVVLVVPKMFVIMWFHHYQALLNSIPGYPMHISNIEAYCNNITFHDQMTINVRHL